jgi:hypothetical protein
MSNSYGSHRFQQDATHRNMCFTPPTCTSTLDIDLVQEDFESFCKLISSTSI